MPLDRGATTQVGGVRVATASHESCLLCSLNRLPYENVRPPAGVTDEDVLYLAVNPNEAL